MPSSTLLLCYEFPVRILLPFSCIMLDLSEASVIFFVVPTVGTNVIGFHISVGFHCCIFLPGNIVSSHDSKGKFAVWFQTQAFKGISYRFAWSLSEVKVCCC
jgi:hypothetical protein